MIQLLKTFGRMLILAPLLICPACSPRSAPVPESGLVGKWQQVDKPAITMTFLKDGTFRADIAGQRLLGGNYQLINGEQVVLNCDASSPQPGPITNRVSLVGQELRVGPKERYKRVQ
jgi:hypothetical protein